MRSYLSPAHENLRTCTTEQGTWMFPLRTYASVHKEVKELSSVLSAITVTPVHTSSPTANCFTWAIRTLNTNSMGPTNDERTDELQFLQAIYFDDVTRQDSYSGNIEVHVAPESSLWLLHELSAIAVSEELPQRLAFDLKAFKKTFDKGAVNVGTAKTKSEAQHAIEWSTVSASSVFDVSKTCNNSIRPDTWTICNALVPTAALMEQTLSFDHP
ncbi:hypothetical protein FB567DRAFT_545695 [Paraphoma chrysanthemicola]|uniref:Uncharacterized protein n=1 Tax=Paraphoma chrysanthemicola TaxID=798071 RepID=A0A8K0RDV9_9PLEO|nr:hypothetical protein FB567DRAFT_545695 [Paraphoma chrysanthemicola]